MNLNQKRIAVFRLRSFKLAVLSALCAMHYGRGVRLTRDGKRSGMWDAVKYMRSRGLPAGEVARILAKTPIEAFEPVEGGGV